MKLRFAQSLHRFFRCSTTVGRSSPSGGGFYRWYVHPQKKGSNVVGSFSWETARVHLSKSQLNSLTEANAFLWAAGIEDTFITAPWPKTGRTLDEYELTDHYNRFRGDIDLMGQLGLRVARYGIPWHRINPHRGVWDWEWTDSALHHLLERGIEPIVDLVHYGLPPWIEGAYSNKEFPQLMAEFASRVAERFEGRIRAYTPLNEPRVTGWYCGKLGWWPPNRRGWRGFVEVMLAICRGIVLTVEALEGIDSEILPVHVDATDLYETDDPSLQIERDRRQEIVFLALDLISGRVNEAHPLRSWLLKQGATNADLDWFQEHQIALGLIGINLYPLFSRKVLTRGGGRLRVRMPYSDATIIDRLASLYWERYHVPIFISETASVGSVKRRQAWLRESVEAVKRVRQRGIPLIGYTWWPLFALITWGYRQGTHPPAFYLKQMGLWDLDPHLDRLPTKLVDEFSALVRQGVDRVGALAPAEEERMAHVS